jgi:hypothetical protein
MQEADTMSSSINPADFPVFGVIPKEILKGKLIDFIEPLKCFAKQDLEIDFDNIHYSKARVIDIVDMIERRRVYFHVYHNIDMGELNEACLICFWILKLAPFYSKTEPNKNVNLVFALALFTRAVTYTAKKRKVVPNLTERVIKHLAHDFTVRDISKESIMAIAESLIG